MAPVKSSVLQRLGRFAFRRRWFIIGSWLVLFAGSALLAPEITSVLKGGGYTTPSSQSDRAYLAVEKLYGSRTLVFTAVFRRSSGATVSTLEGAGTEFVHAVRHSLGSILKPEPPVLAADRAIAFVRLFSRPRADYGIPLTASVRRLLPRTSGVSVYITGASATFYDMEQASDDDVKRMEIITSPIALIILIIIFGTLAGAFVPVAMGPLTVAASLASIFLLGHVLDMSIFVLNTVSMLGLGIAIDYSLFMVQRFREELRRSPSVEIAIVATSVTAGRAIVVSATTVAIGFLGMVTFNVPMLTSLGVGGSVVVAVSLLAALTLLPALLSVLGPRVNALSVLPRSLSSDRFWRALAGYVMRRPWRVIGTVAVVIFLLALPARHLRVGVPGIDILPASAQSRVGDSILHRSIGIADGAPVLVVFESPHGFGQTRIQSRLVSLVKSMCAQPGVAGISATPVVNAAEQVVPCRSALLHPALIPSRLASRHELLISFYLRADPSSAQAESFVDFVRGRRPPAGVSILVGGQTAAQIDFDNYLYGRFPLAILLVVGSILAILAIAFRSVLLPVKAVIMNAFSVLAAYGATVFVFQDGNFQRLFDFTPTGSLDSIVPVFLFCVLFGLSTDYEVFLLMRAREEFARSRDNTGSVYLALQRTGRMITSAALIMVVIFTTFSFANLVIIKELGFALAVGVAVDATLIRALMVPAAMRVFGRWNWWPGIPIDRSWINLRRESPAPRLAHRDSQS